MIAFGGARALDRTAPADRRHFWQAYAVNLGLNAGWTAVFFGVARDPGR